MKDQTYKLTEVFNDYLELWYSKAYAQFIVVDTIEDTENCYTAEEFNFLAKGFKSLYKEF